MPPSARIAIASVSAGPHDAASGRRMSVANRKNARPAVRKMSPSEATFCTGQIGIGMMSPSGPSVSRNSRAFALSSGLWSTVLISPVSPEVSKAACQTGIRPALTMITRAFIAIPTNASAMPGYVRFAHST